MKKGVFPEDFISFYTNEMRLTDVRGEPLTVFADGEVLTRSPVLDFKVLPAHLRVYRKKRDESITREFTGVDA